MRRIDPAELTDQKIHAYLVSDAPLELYALSESFGNIGPIYLYRVEDGKLWIDGIEDDGLYEACIDYLLRHGAPVLATKEARDEHTKKLNERFGTEKSFLFDNDDE